MLTRVRLSTAPRSAYAVFVRVTSVETFAVNGAGQREPPAEAVFRDGR